MALYGLIIPISRDKSLAGISIMIIPFFLLLYMLGGNKDLLTYFHVILKRAALRLKKERLGKYICPFPGYYSSNRPI